jgi:3-keto-disaccharide hydrolase
MSRVIVRSMMRTCCALLLAVTAAAQTPWRPLFDGRTLGEWRGTAFHGGGTPKVADGVLVLPAGGPLSGVTWAGSFPRTDYEIRFEARRMQGNDFFASLTFPVGDSFCTWVMGGWGGDIVGLSSIDGWDASDNETRNYVNFENGRWYAMRLRVTAARITAWIDEKQIIDAEIGSRTIALRPGDIKLSTPLGFASYNTAGELRKIEYRGRP